MVPPPSSIFLDLLSSQLLISKTQFNILINHMAYSWAAGPCPVVWIRTSLCLVQWYIGPGRTVQQLCTRPGTHRGILIQNVCRTAQTQWSQVYGYLELHGLMVWTKMTTIDSNFWIFFSIWLNSLRRIMRYNLVEGVVSLGVDFEVSKDWVIPSVFFVSCFWIQITLSYFCLSILLFNYQNL